MPIFGKRAAFILALMSTCAWGQSVSIEQYERITSAIKTGTCKSSEDQATAEILGINRHAFGYSGLAAIDYLHKHKYQNLTPFDLMMHYCIKPPKPLGRIDQWRYESCQKDAAQAPTQQGVNIGMRICREKFEQ